MKHLKLLSFLKATFTVAFFFACTPVMAQWQVPDHSVPIGRGAGTGFKSAAPGTAGYPLVSNGAVSDPTFQALPSYGSSFLQAGTGAVTLTAQEKMRQIVNVLDYGAKCDGATDDVTAINQIISQFPGRSIQFPSGTCLISSAIVVNANYTSLVGSGFLSTSIVTTSTTDDIIRVDLGSSGLGNVGVQNFVLDATVQKTSGAAVHVYGGTGKFIFKSAIRNINLGPNSADGIRFEAGGFFNIVEDIEAFGVASNRGCALFLGVDSNTNIGDLTLNNINCRHGTSGGATYGFYFNDYVQGVYANSLVAEGAGFDYQFYINHSSGSTAPNFAARNFWITKFIGDSGSKTSMVVDYVQTFRCTDCWTSFSTNEGAVFTSGTDIELKGHTATGNKLNGVRFGANTNHVRVIGGSFAQNSVAATNTYDDIKFEAGASDFSVIGANFKIIDPALVTLSKYNINIVAGASDHYIITNNNLIGYGTAGLLDGGAGTNKVVLGNISTSAISDYVPNPFSAFAFFGPLTGNVTGNLTGNVTGNASGNAGTATKLATARSIYGSSFDGSADINGPIPLANGGTAASTASGARTSLGVTATGSDTTYAYRANNLSDLANAGTARTNLGLGTAATQNTGTSGAAIPFLNGANTWSGAQVFNSGAGTTTVSVNNTGGGVTLQSTGVFGVMDAPGVGGTWQFRGEGFANIVSMDKNNVTFTAAPILPITTVGSLPTCNSGAKGKLYVVTDANATTFWSTVAAGGANNIKVTCDGTNWKIGANDNAQMKAKAA